MIDLYAFATPNSIKVPIALEELGVRYTYHPVNIRQGEQKTADFLALNPNGKVPVIVDSEGPDGTPITITESAAILLYLARKFGGLLPADETATVRMHEWLFFHAASVGPAFGQAGYFQKLAAEKLPAAIARFHDEARRTLKVLDGRLQQAPYFAGDDYTIADIAHFGWIWRRAFAEVDLDETPQVARWYAKVEARPAVQRAIARLTA